MEQEIDAYVGNYYPLVGKLMEQTGMVEILSNILDDPVQQHVVDAGRIVVGLIHNILSTE